MKYSRVHRLLKIVTLLQSGKEWDAKSLARECGTTPRTVFRDLNMLEGAGIPYYFDKHTGGYQIRRDFFMPPVELTLEETLALVCLGEHLGASEQIPFMKPAARAVEKIRGQLPAAISERLEQVAPQVDIRLAASMSPDGVADVYQVVRHAIATRRALRCVYESPRDRQPGQACRALSLSRRDAGPPPSRLAGDQFLFRPYRLFFCQRAWYAVGHHAGRDAIRSLKLSRFLRIEGTDTPYVIPSQFSMRAYLGKAWRMIQGDQIHRVKLHFDAEFAETVADTHWHDTQKVEWLEDGSIHFRCEVAGLDEIVWWVLSMGPHCTVKRPRELTDRVQELAQATAMLYASPTSDGSRRKGKGARGRRWHTACK